MIYELSLVTFKILFASVFISLIMMCLDMIFFDLSYVGLMSYLNLQIYGFHKLGRLGPLLI